MNSNSKNKLKSKYYKQFHGKIDKEIIDAVLGSCHYDGMYDMGGKNSMYIIVNLRFKIGSCIKISVTFTD